MAFSGLHVTCGYIGSAGYRHATVPIAGRAVWSETLATAGTTTNVAPESLDSAGDPFFIVEASADAYVAVGKTPNAATGPRFLVRPDRRIEIYGQPGDKLAWVAA